MRVASRSPSASSRPSILLENVGHRILTGCFSGLDGNSQRLGWFLFQMRRPDGGVFQFVLARDPDHRARVDGAQPMCQSVRIKPSCVRFARRVALLLRPLKAPICEGRRLKWKCGGGLIWLDPLCWPPKPASRLRTEFGLSLSSRLQLFRH